LIILIPKPFLFLVFIPVHGEIIPKQNGMRQIGQTECRITIRQFFMYNGDSCSIHSCSIVGFGNSEVDETELIGGYAVTRSRKKVEEWDGERARDAARAAIVERLATDPMTGEIHGPLKRVASEAVNLTFGLTSTGAKAKMNITGLKGLSLDPSDVRTITPGEVTISYKLAER
jgi:hypothetical protein